MPILNSMDFSTPIRNIDKEDLKDFPITINPIKYIPVEKIIELRKRHLSCSEIAKLLGCSKANIVQRIRKISNEIELTNHYINNRSTVFAFHQRKIMESITEADRKKAGLRDKVISVGVLFDKERLEEGKSTQNIAYADALKARDDALKAEDLAGTEQDQLKKEYPHIDFDEVTINVTP